MQDEIYVIVKNNHFFARRGFLKRTQGKAVETATTTAPIVAMVKRTITITRKTCKDITTEKEKK